MVSTCADSGGRGTLPLDSLIRLGLRVCAAYIRARGGAVRNVLDAGADRNGVGWTIEDETAGA